MIFIRLIFFSLLLVELPVLSAQEGKEWFGIIGSAYTENASYTFLRHLCGQGGGRLMGSAMNEKAMAMLQKELMRYGIDSRREDFTVPGWIRGNDEVIMTLPCEKTLRAAALGYAEKHPAFEADAFWAGFGFDDEYGNNCKGKIAVVTQQRPPSRQPLLRSEEIEIAAAHGAKAILFVNDHPGGTILCGVSNFQGKPSPIPAYSITMEEGKWIERALQDSLPVSVNIATRSFCCETNSANVVAAFQGKSKKKIVIGAHVDAWDVGQGGVDNGIGTAVLLECARLIKEFFPENYYTIECVWFNGEELGLWGSKKYLAMHRDDSVMAMINMDMTGSPTGFNAMGFDESIPLLRSLVERLNGFDLKAGVISVPGTNSDHQPFMLAGIPCISIQAKLDEPMYSNYHDLGDSFDKVSKRYLSDAAAIVSVLIKELASDSTIRFYKRSEKETVDLMRKHGLENRLKKQKEWRFKE